VSATFPPLERECDRLKGQNPFPQLRAELQRLEIGARKAEPIDLQRQVHVHRGQRGIRQGRIGDHTARQRRGGDCGRRHDGARRCGQQSSQIERARVVPRRQTRQLAVLRQADLAGQIAAATRQSDVAQARRARPIAQQARGEPHRADLRREHKARKPGQFGQGAEPGEFWHFGRDGEVMAGPGRG